MAFLIQLITWTAWTAAGLNVVAFVGGVAATGALQATHELPARQPASWVDLLARAVAVALFVAAVLVVSSVLGPRATGVLAAFPIVFVVMIFILRPRIGGAGSALLAATALKAMGGFGLMLLTVHLAVVPLGAAVGLCLSLVPTLAWSAILAILHRRKHV